MYSSTSYPSHHRDTSNDPHGRPTFGHSHSQPFVVAGMTSQGPSHSPSLRSGSLGSTGGGGLTIGMTDSLSQSRSHYQPGYLMSANPHNASSQSPGFDDAPIVQTKAKMNPLLSGSSAVEFGMDSMFESSRQRQRQTLADEDAPPMNSVNDIVNEIYEPASARRSTALNFDSPARGSLFRPSHSQVPSMPKPSTPGISNAKPLYVVVFGYPPDKFSVTVDYFRSLGSGRDATTQADPNVEIANCFRIGYINPAEAMRAVRKNGEVLGGSYMIGVKWADPAQAEALLGSPLARSPLAASTTADISSPDVTMSDASPPLRGFVSSESASSSMALTTVQRAQTPPVGTPIKLAPSTSAYRKPGIGGKLPSIVKPGDGTPGGLPTQSGGLQASTSKGVFGQVSDLIFGW